MKGKRRQLPKHGDRDTIEGFLFWPRSLYTDARHRELEWRWLERARISLEVVSYGKYAEWKEMHWLPLKEVR